MTPNPNPSPELKVCPNPWCKDSDLCVERSRASWSASPPRRVECQCGMVGPEAATDALAIAAWNTRALSPQTLPAPGEVEARAAHIAAYSGPVVSFDVTAPYYLASCDGCGWVGSSENCGTDTGCDDSNVYCPRCDASGADCGKIATQSPPWTLATVAAANDEGVTGEALFRAFMAGDVSRLTTTALPEEWPHMQPSYRKAWEDLANALATSRSQHEGASS